MKYRLRMGVATLVLLTACGGGASQTSTATTPPTAVAVAPEATTNTAAPTMVVTPEMTATTLMMDTPTAEATTAMMDLTVTPEATMAMTAEATVGAMDSTVVPAANGGDGDTQQVILNAMRAQLSGGPFRSETTIESNGQTHTVQGAFIPPNRMQATSSVGGNTTEIIIVDDKMWTKTGDQWTEVPGGGGNITQMMSEMVTNPDANGLQITNTEAAGTEDVNGTTAAVYTYESAFATGGQTIATTGKMWIDTATGRPIQLESEGEFAGIKSTTRQVITYDSSITIEPPTQ